MMEIDASAAIINRADDGDEGLANLPRQQST
jgi:hypothetical protein